MSVPPSARAYHIGSHKTMGRKPRRGVTPFTKASFVCFPVKRSFIDWNAFVPINASSPVRLPFWGRKIMAKDAEPKRSHQFSRKIRAGQEQTGPRMGETHG
jgi:hypothetical protein